jgi:hypothetical protein
MGMETMDLTKSKDVETKSPLEVIFKDNRPKELSDFIPQVKIIHTVNGIIQLYSLDDPRPWCTVFPDGRISCYTNQSNCPKKFYIIFQDQDDDTYTIESNELLTKAEKCIFGQSSTSLGWAYVAHTWEPGQYINAKDCVILESKFESVTSVGLHKKITVFVKTDNNSTFLQNNHKS